MGHTRGRDVYSSLFPIVKAARSSVRLIPLRIARVSFSKSAVSDSLFARLFREAMLHRLAAACGDLVDVRRFVTILGLDGLYLGSRISIHPYTYIDATGGVVVSDDVSIAHGVTIMSTTHNFSDVEKPIRDQGLAVARVTIEKDVWIGAGARILAGVTIGSGSVVGSGAVVIKDVPAYSIVGGVPAKVIRSRR